MRELFWTSRTISWTKMEQTVMKMKRLRMLTVMS